MDQWKGSQEVGDRMGGGGPARLCFVQGILNHHPSILNPPLHTPLQPRLYSLLVSELIELPEEVTDSLAGLERTRSSSEVLG